ncbi:hypothetical protein HU200_022472 [Digitaria exilis]|uniref:Tubulin-folding cofactor D C-terminal domain-containing protein n=1 Tax=Digitaria exilis TaxID=1010633 RepID=A0A835C6K4_9POAL|nr:hypothetical protein HU200_022472 [Digitaria exilis]
MEETAAAAASPAPNAAKTAVSDPAAGAAADGEASADPTAVGDDEHDSKEVVLRRYFLQEWELVSAILHRIVAAGGVADPGDVHRIRSIVSDLELAVALLEKCHTMSSATALRQESTGEMETKCVILLWLYILVLIPFDISTVDTSIATADSVDGAEVVPLVTRILDICKDYLSSSGPMRRMSGLLLARLLTRPDMTKAFSRVMVPGMEAVWPWLNLLGEGYCCLLAFLMLYTMMLIVEELPSAAFQENVGRQGTFPHGIDIVNTTDYFALASRSNSYLNVAVSVAQYKDIFYPFADELLCNKINSLGTVALCNKLLWPFLCLYNYDMDYFGGHALEKLVPYTLSSDLCTRHGSTLAAGEVALRLYQLGFTFSTVTFHLYLYFLDMQKALSGIVPAIEKAPFIEAKEEDHALRCSRFISCISIAGISMNEKIKKSLLENLHENLRHSQFQIQCAAVDALKHFIPTYLDKPDDPDAEARVNSVRGLISVCETLTSSFDQSSNSKDSLYAYIKDNVMRALFRALDDYAVDNRGDVGSWVREAAMDALERCSLILCRRDIVLLRPAPASGHESERSEREVNASSTAYRLFDSGIAQDLVSGIAKQAVEKIDKMREIAIKTLQKILYHQEHLIPFIPHRELLEEIIPKGMDLEWAVSDCENSWGKS